MVVDAGCQFQKHLLDNSFEKLAFLYPDFIVFQYFGPCLKVASYFSVSDVMKSQENKMANCQIGILSRHNSRVFD